MADFETTLLGLPAYGNFGVRAVKTNITSSGVQSDFFTFIEEETGIRRFDTVDTGGDNVVNSETNSFWNVLPSANLSHWKQVSSLTVPRQMYCCLDLLVMMKTALF